MHPARYVLSLILILGDVVGLASREDAQQEFGWEEWREML